MPIVKAETGGLLFNANDKLIEERTSYHVFEEIGNQIVTDSLLIEFPISIYKKNSFGYIFQLFDIQNGVIYSLTYEYDDKALKGLFKLNKEAEGNLIVLEFDATDLGDNKWQDLSLMINLQKQTCTLAVADKSKTVSLNKGHEKLKFDLQFGKYKHMVDVASFKLEKLTVFIDNNKLEFPFTEHEGTVVHDSQGKQIGLVKNPIWQITKFYNWEKIYSSTRKSMSSICFDAKNQNMLILSQTEITFFNLETKEAIDYEYKNNLPFNILLGNSIIDTIHNRVYLYEINDLPSESSTIAYLDLTSLTWHVVSHKQLEKQIHHHNILFDSNQEIAYIFGGFGNKRYSNTFLRLDLKNDIWDTLKVDTKTLYPRYFSGITSSTSGKEWYIYGGMGNESGNQTIGRKYYYDLHKLDLETLSISKLWEIESPEVNTISTRNMIMTNDTTFLTLSYPEHLPQSYLLLYEHSIKHPNAIQLGDTINIVSEKIETNANLYYSKVTAKLYCAIVEYNDDGSSQTSIYSINYHPVSLSQLKNTNKETTFFTKNAIILLIVVGSILLFSAFIYIRLRNRKNRKHKFIPTSLTQLTEKESVISKQDNAIYLFGSFTIYDKKQKSIEYMFSTRLRNTLVIIIYHTFLNGGIGPDKLNSILWPDNDDEVSLKNLRNVTISQLRKKLTELDGINLVFENNLYSISYTDNFHCDYILFQKYLKERIEQKNINPEHFFSILERGPFLESGTDLTLLNDIYQNTKTLIYTLFFNDLEKKFIEKEFQYVIRLSEILFKYNPLDEKVLFYKINVYYELGQVKVAQNLYLLFAAKYKQENKEDFNLSFESFIE